MTRAELIATLLPPAICKTAGRPTRSTTPGRTTYQVRRWLLSRLPDGMRKPAERVRGPARRDHPDRDGMTDLYAYLPTEVAEALFTALDTLARTNTVPDDQRTLAQRRADAVGTCSTSRRW